jgi:hypothetical protein
VIDADADGDGCIQQDQTMDGNPSARRGAVVIEFSCEGCGHHSLLEMAQHKGQTLVRWSPIPAPVPCDPELRAAAQVMTRTLADLQRDQLAEGPRPFAWCKTRGPNALIRG